MTPDGGNPIYGNEGSAQELNKCKHELVLAQSHQSTQWYNAPSRRETQGKYIEDNSTSQIIDVGFMILIVR